MLTLYVHGAPLHLNTALLLRQAAALGRVLGPPPTPPSRQDAELLTGIWHMLHDLLDHAEVAGLVTGARPDRFHARH